MARADGGSEDTPAGRPETPTAAASPAGTLVSPSGADSAPADATSEEGGGNVPASARRRRSRLALLAEYGVVSLFTVAVSWPFLRPGRALAGFDTVAYTAPNLKYTIEAWRDGRLALWNGRIFGGVTHLGNPQAGALYPLKVLAVPFGVSTGIAVLIVVHLLILANGMVALVGWRLRLRPPSATVAAAALVGSGLIMQKTLQLEQLLVLAWLPLLLALIHTTITAARPWLAAAATAVVTALVLTAGHPQMVYTLAPLAIGTAIAVAADTRAWRRLGHVAAAAAVGALLAAPQLLPAFEAARDGALSGARPLSEVRDPTYNLDPSRALRTLLGNPRASLPDADSGTYEALSFIGAAAGILALVGFVDGIRRRDRRILTAVLGGLGTLGVLAALGPRTAPYRFAYDHLPLFDQARVPARWLAVTVIAAAVLAGLGVDAVVGRRLDRRALTAIAAVLAVTALLVVTGVFSTPGPVVVVLWLVAAALALVAAFVPAPADRRWQLLVLALPAIAVLGELGLASRHAVAARSETARSIDSYSGDVVAFLNGLPGREVALTLDNFDDPAYLVAALRPNTNVLFAIPSLDGYDGGVQVTKRWATAVATLAKSPFANEFTLRSQLAEPVDPALAARFGVRWVVLDTTSDSPEHAVPGWRGPLAADGPVQVFENPAWQGDAVAWFSTIGATGAEDAAHLLASGSAPPNTAVVEGEEPELACSDACPSMGLQVERPQPELADLTVELPRDAVVALDEQDDGGWHVTVDGHDAPTVTVDGLFAGVRVPAGQHFVHFRYEPPGFRAGLWLAGLGALLVLAATAWAVQERRVVARATAGPSRLAPNRSPAGE